MIEVRSFSKTYENTIAVRDLSFQVWPGAILGLVGRNGAGKTTTLRSLAGIIPTSHGQLTVAGFDVQTQPVKAKQVTAYVPDDPQLFGDLSVEQHLKFTASVYGITKPTDSINQLLQTFELESKRHAAATGLSRGMRQKLAICCAYLSQPKALLLDEPMTGLDPQAIRQLKQSIHACAQTGVAVMISSHLLAMVEDICTHVLILDAGQAKFCGPLAALQQSYQAQQANGNTSLESAYFSLISGSAGQNDDGLSGSGATVTSSSSVVVGV